MVSPELVKLSMVSPELVSPKALWAAELGLTPEPPPDEKMYRRKGVRLAPVIAQDRA